MNFLCFGYGSIAKRHISNLNSLKENSNFRVIRKSLETENLSDNLDISFQNQVNKQDYDWAEAIIIASPPAFHIEPLVQAIKYNIPFYIEKPIVATREHLYLLNNLIEKTPSLPANIVGCNLRFLSSIKKVKHVIDDKLLGKIVRASFDAGQWLPDWRIDQNYRKCYSAQKNLGGGVILDLIHEIDIAQWLFGDYQDIHAFASTNNLLDIETEAVCSAILRNNNDTLVNINLDYISRSPRRHYVFIGELKSLVWDMNAKTLTIAGQNHSYTQLADAHDFNMADSYIEAMKTWLTLISKPTINPYDLPNGLKSMELALQIKEAALL